MCMNETRKWKEGDQSASKEGDKVGDGGRYEQKKIHYFLSKFKSPVIYI